MICSTSRARNTEIFREYYIFGDSRVKVSVSFLHCLLYGALIGIIGVGLFTLVAFALAKLQKGMATFKMAFEATSVVFFPE